MRTIQQYVDEKKGKRYYYSSTPIFCDYCETQLTDFVVIRACWDKKKSFIKQHCFNCSDKHVQMTQAEEKLVMSIVSRKPIGSKLVIITPLELKNSSKDDSLFCNTIDTPYTNNKASRSFHPDYTVLDDSAPAQIGPGVDEEKEAEKNKLLDSDQEIKSLLNNIMDEQILVGDDEEKKKIGCGKQ